MNTSGDLEITWLPAVDPQSQFFGYEIFVANNRLGPYSSVSATAGAISNTQFVHTTTVTNVQSVYVYVRSLFGTAGVNSSGNSDTLQSIFLNINVSTADAYKLSYNAPRTPLLGSYSPTLSISRAYLGNWQVIRTTGAYTYFDTLSYCNKAQSVIQYTVAMPDNSGCVNGSNYQGGTYDDRHNPFVIYIDSISVLENGNTCIGWKPALDKDVVKYIIQQQNQAGLNPTIAAVPGYSSTTFVLTNQAANTGTVGLYVQAIDSCGNGGVVDYAPVSMFLNVNYNYCAFRSELTWTKYSWAKINNFPIDEVLEYRIYCSVDSGATYSLIGATTSQSFVHNNVTKNKDVLYFVRVVSKFKSITASSNRRGFYSGEVPAPTFLYIKSCSVTKKNTIELSIHTDKTKPFHHLVIYRSEDGLHFDTIGTVVYKAISNYSYIDEGVYTDARPYYYYAWLLDSCSNFRTKSNTTKSILLQVTEEKENVFQRNLSWTAYEGFEAGVREYQVWRFIDDAGATELIGRTDSAGRTFSDNLESAVTVGARIEYQIKAVENFGNQYAVQEICTSNFAKAYMEGRVFVPNAFAPEGVNSTWKPVTQYIENREYNVTVFNNWGTPVFETSDIRKAWDGANAPAGVYVYLVSYKSTTGEYVQLTGSVMLIR